MLIVERLALLLVDGTARAFMVEPDRLRRALATAYLVDLCEAGLLDLVANKEDVRLVRGDARSSPDTFALRAAERVLGFEPTPLPNAARALRSGLVRHVYGSLAVAGDVEVNRRWCRTRIVELEEGGAAAARWALRDVLLGGRSPAKDEHVVIAILAALGVAERAAGTTGDEATSARERASALSQRSIADDGVNGTGRWGMTGMVLWERTVGEQALVQNELLMYWLNDVRAAARVRARATLG